MRNTVMTGPIILSKEDSSRLRQNILYPTVENLQKEVEELKRIVEMQNDIIRDLREQLRKNSSNS